MHMLPRWLALTTMVAAAVPTLEAQPPSPSQIARVTAPRQAAPIAQPLPNGCYALSFGDWLYSEGWQGDPGDAIPARVVIDTMPLRWRSRFRTLQVERRVAADSAYLDRSSWESIGPDSVGIAWTDGSAGMELRLAIDGDTLRGRAHVYPAESRDAFKEPRATAVAARVPCRASTPVASVADSGQAAPRVVAPRVAVPTTSADSALAQREAGLQADRLHRGETLLAMERINLAIRQFQRAAARLPKQLDELLTLRTERVQPSVDWLVDGWGRAIAYVPGISGYILRSAGADGVQWTRDDIVVTKKPR